MKELKRINSNPAQQSVEGFLAATNAYAEQLRQRGEPADFITAANARGIYQKLIKTAIAFYDPSHSRHNDVFNSLSGTFGRDSEALGYLYNIGEQFMRDSQKLAGDFQKSGMSAEKSVEAAFNSLAGNPVFDHFGNLNLLAGQRFQEMAFVETWLGSGDAIAVPVEPGGTGLDTSRFRAPVEQVTGSSKIMQGDINPLSIRDDNNRTQISLYNEFKNAVTLSTVFSITQAMRDQTLGYARAVAPALAGFILQNRYFQAAQKQILKLAELLFVGGQNAAGSYTANVGGSYGILSSAIQLELSDAAAATPAVASTADWLANPTKIVQKIVNAVYKLPTTNAAQLTVNTASATPENMYKEIIRLFQMAAQANVNFAPKEWALFVPTSWYNLAMQYPASGTFNKQLEEMVNDATSGIINKIRVIPSSLLNYAASIGPGGTNAYNYMVAVALGCAPESKPVIMPGQTALPVVTAENVSASIMNFRTEYVFGGPMFMHYGGAFVLEFSGATT